MDVERAFEFEEGMKTESLWFRGSDLKNIPIKTLNENFDPSSEDPNTDMYKDLIDENGEVMTRKGEFLIQIDFGAGMPNSPSFIYQSTIELHRENIITQEEARATLKTVLNYPIVDPYNPQGKFIGRNNSAEQLAMANDMMLPQEQQQIPGQMDMNQMLGMMGGGGQPPVDALAMLEQAIQQLPPEVLQQIFAGLGGGMPGAY